MSTNRPLAPVVEAYYSANDLAALWRFGAQKILAMVKAGDFTLRNAQGVVVAEPMEVAGEVRIPASAINDYAVRHPYRYTDEIKARNKGELLRKLQGGASARVTGDAAAQVNGGGL